MSEQREELDRLVDDYADGSLDSDRARRLLALLEASGEARERLASVVVAERLLRALGRGPVATGRIMSALREQEKQRALPLLVSSGRPLWPAIAVLAILALSAVAVLRLRHPPARRPAQEAPRVTRVRETEPIRQEADQGGASYTSPVSPVETNAPTSIVVAAQPASLLRGLPPELPPPPPDVDPNPPAGDGSGEPGFVAPPAGWLEAPLAPPPDGSVSGGRREPAPPLLWVKADLGERRLWNATPDDVSSLMAEVRGRLKLNFGAEVRPLAGIEEDPERNPVVFVTSHFRFAFTAEQRALLRRFLIQGGMIVFDAGLGSAPAYQSARRELRLILPEKPIERLSRDHPIFHAYHELDQEPGGAPEPWLEGVSIACRTAAVISRWGLAAGWAGREVDAVTAHRPEDALRLGVNLCAYAASIRAWTKPVPYGTGFVDDTSLRSSRVFVAQVIHEGEWMTRYAGMPILLQSFNARTEVPVTLGIWTLRLTDPRLFNAPLLYFTGHEAVTLSEEEAKALRRYLENGGFLLAEACCGRRSFDTSFRSLMRDLLPGKPLEPIPEDSVLYREPNAIGRLSVTRSLAARTGSRLIRPALEGVRIGGHFGVIYSRYGLAGAWESAQMPYADGYDGPEAIKLGQNILLYAVTQ
jgi:hypothetical protein